MGINMRKLFTTIFDWIILLAGMIMIPPSFLKWKDTGFSMEGKFDIGTSHTGGACFLTIVIGITLICYAIIDLRMIRKRNGEKQDDTA
jgi:hypothetical protein